MRYILFIFLFYSIFQNVIACSLYELHGFVRLNKLDLYLNVAPNTKSEKKLPVFFKVGPTLSPYINSFITGEFILEKDIQSSVKILGVNKIEYSVYNPLVQNENNTFKKIKEIECPR